MAIQPGQRQSWGLRIRYRQPLQKGEVVCDAQGQWFMDFETPQRGIAAGQFAAWNEDNMVVGSAVISA